MKMINSVSLTGRLTNEPNINQTEGGDAVANFILAVNRSYTNAQGEREADFIQCVAWKKTADVIRQYVKKGSLIGVEGSIQTRNYENNQGQRVYVTEVQVRNLTLLETKSNNNTQGNQNQYNQQGQSQPQQQTQYNQQTAQGNQQQPHQQQYNQQQHPPDRFSASSDPVNISDDDLPF